MRNIDKTAIISRNAIIEDDVFIGAYSYIGEGVHLKKGVKIYHHASIFKDTEIGEDSIVYPFSSLGTDPQDLKYKGEKTFLKIGKNTTIREFCDFNTASGEGTVTEIGDNCFIMAYCHVAHNCKVGNNVVMANLTQLAGHVTIDDNAILGGNVGIHQFCRIGSYAMIGAASTIRKNVVPYGMIMSDPTRLKSFNIIGLRRNGFADEEIDEIKELFKIMFHSKLTIPSAIKKIEETFPNPDKRVKYFIDFIKGSQRGILV